MTTMSALVDSISSVTGSEGDHDSISHGDPVDVWSAANQPQHNDMHNNRNTFDDPQQQPTMEKDFLVPDIDDYNEVCFLCGSLRSTVGAQKVEHWV